MAFSLIAALYERNIREPEYKSECSPGSVTTRNLDRLGWFLNQKDCLWNMFHWQACIVCNIQLMRDMVQRCPSDWNCPWPRKEPWFNQLSSSDWRFDVQKCTAPGRLGGQMGSLDETKYNTRIEQKQEDWHVGTVEEMIGIGMLTSRCELWSFHCLWSGLTCQDMLLHDMSMAETYNENMKKSKEYRRWLQAKQTCTQAPRDVSLVFNLLGWVCFRCFFCSLAASCQAAMKDFHTCPRQGPIVGMTEDTMNVYRQAKNCSKSWLCWMGWCQKSSTKRDGNRGLGQRIIDWHLIDSAGGESKAMTYEVCLILRVCCCSTFL